MTLPAGATQRKSGASKALQAVGRSLLFQLGQPDHLLSISELSPTEQACPARLEAEWQRMRKATKETDLQRLEVRKVGVAQDLVVGGARVLYNEAQQRGFGAADAGRSSAMLASVMFCAKTDLVVVMLASQQSELPGNTQDILKSIVASGSSAP